MNKLIKKATLVAIILSSLSASAYLQVDSDKWGMTTISDGSSFMQCYSNRVGSTTCY